MHVGEDSGQQTCQVLWAGRGSRARHRLTQQCRCVWRGRYTSPPHININDALLLQLLLLKQSICILIRACGSLCQDSLSLRSYVSAAVASGRRICFHPLVKGNAGNRSTKGRVRIMAVMLAVHAH